MSPKTLGATLMVMFFVLTTALFLATFSESKDVRSRAAGNIYATTPTPKYIGYTPTPTQVLKYYTPTPTYKKTYPTPTQVLKRYTPTPTQYLKHATPTPIHVPTIESTPTSVPPTPTSVPFTQLLNGNISASTDVALKFVSQALDQLRIWFRIR